ncbi:MAG TPA: PIG-L family deacetylase [Phycisphaerae bacterium]|nr:PIG-L family deacetylase [Phycisphaerales bacterium]HRX85655.1 PIG-L family deacetylase [Phycisphaerae bacterium]
MSVPGEVDTASAPAAAPTVTAPAPADAAGVTGHRGLRRLLRRALEMHAAPMTTEELLRPAIVFAPHQDDETLGCGGTILRKRRAGAPVTIVFLTDGYTSHADRMDVGELVAQRRREALAAAAALGVAERNVIFLNITDATLSQQIPDATRRVTSLLCDERPQQIFVTSRWDNTPDHVAAGEIVSAAAADVCPKADLFEYLVWYWAHWPWAPRRDLKDSGESAWRQALRRFRRLFAADLVRVPIAELHDAKWTALCQHASQMHRPVGDPGWPVLADVWAGGFLDCAFADCELFIRR